MGEFLFEMSKICTINVVGRMTSVSSNFLMLCLILLKSSFTMPAKY